MALIVNLSTTALLLAVIATATFIATRRLPLDDLSQSAPAKADEDDYARYPPLSRERTS